MEAYILCLLKAEDPEAYKKLAEKGIMVGFPVKVRGKTHRADNGIGYHSTVKFFNPDKDTPEAIHDVARKLSLHPPDPKETRIEPSVFKDRMGNDVYVLKLHGSHADSIKEHHKKFSHLGYPATYEYQPHVSVDKKTWDEIVESKAQTAHEAGIEFGHAELKQGHNTLATYKPAHQEQPGQAPKLAPNVAKPTKLAASEDLEKGALRNLGTAIGVAGALAVTSPSAGNAPHPHEQGPKYSSKKMLQTIADVESSGGKDQNHKELGGMHSGEKAYGKYGLTPVIIRETIKLHPELKAKHKKAMHLQGQDLHNYMQDNPGLEDAVAQRHLKRLEHHFGRNPAHIGYAWLQGISGTYKVRNDQAKIDEHWHVKKIKDAYAKGK